MKKVFKLCKFVFMVAFIFGGWTLAAASLHVVHAPGAMLWNKVPYNVRVVPKSNLTFKDTFVDTTKWTVADLDAHPEFVARLQQANRTCLIEQAEKTPAPSQATASATNVEKHHVDPAPTPVYTSENEHTAPATPAQEKPKPKSIFDFSK